MKWSKEVMRAKVKETPTGDEQVSISMFLNIIDTALEKVKEGSKVEEVSIPIDLNFSDRVLEFSREQFLKESDLNWAIVDETSRKILRISWR